MLTITNKNIYLSDYSLSLFNNMDNVEIVDIENIVNFLSDDVELGESVTFRRLFDLISSNLFKFNEIFYSALGGHSLEPFLQEIENNVTDVIDSEYLEIHWFSERYENELTISPTIHGISTISPDFYSIEFVSLNNLKNLNVKLNKNVDIFDINRVSQEIIDNKSKFNNKDEVLNKIDDIIINATPDKVEKLGKKSFTLFDLFNGILSEISFHGGPQDKIELFGELENSIEESTEEYQKMEVTEGMSFDEILDKMDSKDIYLVKYKNDRDRLEEDRLTNPKNINKLKKCLLEKLKIYDTINNSDKKLTSFYKKLTHIEYNMQLLYGEEEDISYHRFWLTPKCTCPKIDNIELYPSNNPIFDVNCPIHKK